MPSRASVKNLARALALRLKIAVPLLYGNIPGFNRRRVAHNHTLMQEAQNRVLAALKEYDRLHAIYERETPLLKRGPQYHATLNAREALNTAIRDRDTLNERLFPLQKTKKKK